MSTQGERKGPASGADARTVGRLADILLYAGLTCTYVRSAGSALFHDFVNPCPATSLTLRDVEEPGHPTDVGAPRRCFTARTSSVMASVTTKTLRLNVKTLGLAHQLTRTRSRKVGSTGGHEGRVVDEASRMCRGSARRGRR